MAASSSAAQLRSIYRSLLRELPPRPVLAAPRSHLHTRLRESFASTSPSSPSSPRAAALEAEQLVLYLRSQRMYATLLDRYNPGMNMDEEERLRLTARRVGMEMPLSYKKDGSENSS
ncbi:ATP synthase assembly factor fmc1 [Paramyrothecium foliicola]|nr:ATP synthase assembly factor fmc1 [Paramyrothecium foliicola]